VDDTEARRARAPDSSWGGESGRPAGQERRPVSTQTRDGWPPWSGLPVGPRRLPSSRVEVRAGWWLLLRRESAGDDRLAESADAVQHGVALAFADDQAGFPKRRRLLAGAAHRDADAFGQSARGVLPAKGE